MIYDFITIGIIVASLIIIAVIISRKFPMMAAINTAVLPKHKQDKIKKDLIEDRLKRKFSFLNFKKMLTKTDAGDNQSSFVARFRNMVKNLEQKYKQKITELEPADQNDVDRKKIIIRQEAKALVDQEKFKEAEGKYIEVISLDPKDIAAYQGLAEVYTLMKDYLHAKETYNFILKLNATDDSAYEQLGQIAFREGKLDEAEKDYMQSLSLNSQVAGYHVDLGEVYVAMGDFKKALRSFEEAIRLEPNNPRILDCAVTATIKLKDKESARKYFKKLKEVNPENEKLSELKRLVDNL